MPTIRIDDDVMAGLKRLAEPFVDTPNSVIRMLLAAHEKVPTSAPEAHQAPSSRAAITPQKVYEPFLLKLLADGFGGTASKAAVTGAVIEEMKRRGLLDDADFDRVSTGETKAENMIAWARNAMKDRGLISASSQRGSWELTPTGMAQAGSIDLDAQVAK